MTLNPALQEQIRIASQWYNINETRWIEIVCQAAIDRLISDNPNIAESFDLR